MYLQRPKVLRRQANRRSRSLSRHEQPKLAQLSNALRNASADRQRNQGVPVLCRWRMYQKSQGNGGRVSRAKQLKDHLSYGGRVALRRYPFFMPGTHQVCCLDCWSKIEKTSKLITNACLFFKNGGSGIPVERQARKNKQAMTNKRARKDLTSPGIWDSIGLCLHDFNPAISLEPLRQRRNLMTL